MSWDYTFIIIPKKKKKDPPLKFHYTNIYTKFKEEREREREREIEQIYIATRRSEAINRDKEKKLNQRESDR